MSKLIFTVMWLIVLFAVFPANRLYAQPTAEAVAINGSVAYRQRIAMPPDAVLTVRVEDVSIADKPALVLAEINEAFGTRQVPIPFSLQVPNRLIDPNHRYVIRATISVAGKLRFTTTRHYAVLTQDAPSHIDLLLDAVQPASKAPALVSKHALAVALPATFVGVTACADCSGIEQTLTLRADGLYRLRRIYQGKPDGTYTELGRWSTDASAKRLTLLSGPELSLLEVIDSDTLRQLDRLGQPITSPANQHLRRAAQVEPITESLHWHGEFSYMADAATFTDCASGKRWPVATLGDYLAVERNYLQARSAPAAPLLVNFDGRLEVLPAMGGLPIEQIVVDRFDGSQPGATCSSLQPGKATSLTDTYWKLIELDGNKVEIASTQQREVRITLASEGARVNGFSGCNRFMGGYDQDGNSLKFTQMAGTMMACEAPLMELESQVLKMLSVTTSYRIDNGQLNLLAGDKVLARFEAVYLR